MTQAFMKEFGSNTYQDLFQALQELIYSQQNKGSVSNGELVFKMTINTKKQTAFGTCSNPAMSVSFDFELAFGKYGNDVTYFHNNLKKKTNLGSAQSASLKKECSCNWSFLHSSKGCQCGAITPYKPKYN